MYLNILQAIANVGKDQIVRYTTALNIDRYPNAIDAFMDSAIGRGHRIIAGHDLINLPQVYNRFGISGVGAYFKHLGKDIMSPDGIPIPFAQDLQAYLGLSTQFSIDWLCINIGDLLSGTLSIWHTRTVLLMVSKGELSDESIFGLALGAATKIFFSVWSPNPISLACGIIDSGALVYSCFPLIKAKVLWLIAGELSWNEILLHALKISGVSFLLSFTIHLINNVASTYNQLDRLKHSFITAAKEASIDSLIAGTACFISETIAKSSSLGKAGKCGVALSVAVGIKVGFKFLDSKQVFQRLSERFELEYLTDFSDLDFSLN